MASGSSGSIASQIREHTLLVPEDDLRREVMAHLDEGFADLDVLLGRGPAAAAAAARKGKGKRRRGLEEEIEYWRAKEASAFEEVSYTSSRLPGLLHETQTKLQTLLKSSQDLSLQRYALADQLSMLVRDLDPSASDTPEAEDPVLSRMEGLQAELKRLEAGLSWTAVLEQVLLLSERTLAAGNHHPTPLAALPHYRELVTFTSSIRGALPAGMGLTSVIEDIRAQTWQGLKDVMSKNLLTACEALKWPLKVDYPSVPPAQRRAFERAFQDLLILQAEGEVLHDTQERQANWTSGEGLYPVQAMVQAIALRFKYHFQGSRSTNRADKPEWAFTNILDQIYQHQAFIRDYLQPLIGRAGYESISVKSEFILLLCPLLLTLLRARLPRLVAHPALLAHTIYQTILFDDAVRDAGFDLDSVSINEGRENAIWEGLAGVILKEEGWFDQWLAGEKKFADNQLQEVISSPSAWTISTDIPDEESLAYSAKPTISARQVKALVEQVTDRYSPLPGLEYKLAFITSLQLPLLVSYLSRISGSLDAFETLSSAFVRAVPGALAGNMKGGIYMDQKRLTGDGEGLGRLIKAGLSAGWILAALRQWSNDLFFVELSEELSSSLQLRWKIQSDENISSSLISPSSGSADASIFDHVIQRYSTLSDRVEDMIVRLVTVEVENDLKKHLQRRWDSAPSAMLDSEPGPESTEFLTDSSLIASLTTLSSHLAQLAQSLPPSQLLRLYRRIASLLTNHIGQRGVYSGWSKFTHTGGKEFAREVEEFKQVSTSSLATAGIPVEIVNGTWSHLGDIGKLLSLPTEAEEEGGVTFAQAMAGAWGDGEESFGVFKSRLGVEMDRAGVQAVLRRRVECWR